MDLITFRKRMISFILLIALLVGIFPAGILTQSSAATGELPEEKAQTRVAGTVGAWDNDGDGVLSVLCIGNSFSQDAMEYFYQIANNLGITKMVLGNLYIGGCTLATHASNAANDSAAYIYYKNTSGSWTSTNNVKMSTALTERSWDFVTMQQASPDSGKAETYGSNLTNLIAYVKSKLKNPNATKLAWHMTWAYQANSTHSGFANYSKNQTTMYDAIVSAVNSQIVPNRDIEIIIPTGTAIQNLRSSILGDNLTRDGHHLSNGVGRYTAALMFVRELTGLDISGVTWKSTSTALSANGEEKFLAIEAVNFAYDTPLKVTTSHYTGKADPTWQFVQISPGYNKYKYWYSTGDYHTNMATTSDESNAKKFICTNKLSKTGTTGFNSYLPVGSIIVLNSDYQYRPEGWVVDNQKQTGKRPDVVTDTYVIVTEEWWGNYTKRAFNISHADGTEWSNGFAAANTNHYLRLYIPVEKVLDYYFQMDLTYELNKYWNSSSTHKLQNTTTANQNIFFGAHLPSSVTSYNPVTGTNVTTSYTDLRITKDMLPEGKGLISLRTGYKLRQEGWKNGSTLNTTATRPGETETNLMSTTSGWWGDWTLRGFNISLDGEGTNNANNDQAKMESYILRVYINRDQFPCANQLEKELENAQKYLRWNNRLGVYPADVYAEFKQCVTESEAFFRQRNGIRFVVPCSGDTKTAVETGRNHQAHKLKDLIDQLAYYDVSRENSNFIDLPIEVLDFRADGILFDNYNTNNPYSLVNTSPAISNALTGASMSRPGSVYTGTNGVDMVENLTLPQLVDGNLTYREETVTYVAHALAQKLYTFSDSSMPDYFKASYYGANWNNVFMDKVTGGFGTTDIATRLGSWSDTLKKVGKNQGLDGTKEGTNGGVLLYSQVTTAFDMAYYLLNNIWRSVGFEDPLLNSSGDVITRTDGQPMTYNTVVEELTSIRLLKDSSGNYSFNSGLDVGRHLDSGTIFNTENDKLTYHPNLNATAGLGFEHPSLYKPSTTGLVYGRSVTTSDYYSNHDYMIHAKGVFVYHKGKNLEFSFTGDDDVYFYINGHLACDVGGMHPAASRSRKLNDIADTLGLVDGDVCTFDMYLVDRHGTQVNLYFSTNIELMSAEAITAEPQRDYRTGATISNNAIVADGTDVGFAFNLLNRSDYPVKNLTFKNDNLGASLSPDALVLGNVDGGSLDEKAGNLTITYTAYDPATAKYTSTAPQVFTGEDFETLYSIIEAGCNSDSTIPLAEQAYQISGLTAEQVMMLLELGLPCNVQISIYGFHHKVYASVGTYNNEVTTICYPVLKDGSLGPGILGIASTSVQAKNMESTVATPLQIVMDYGKPIEFGYDDIMTRVTLSAGANASCIGLNLQGSHGQISDYKPSGMMLTNQGDTYTSSNGTYEYHGNGYRFTLNRMLEEVEKINAVIEIQEVGVSLTWYLMVSIEILPATMVYYEAEDFVGTEFTYEELSSGTASTEYQTVHQEDGKSLTDTELNSYINGPDPTHDTSMLYFGFGKSTEDGVRYDKNPIYNGKNYDTNSNWYGTTGYTLNIANGVMNYTATTTGTNTWAYFSTGTTNKDLTALSYQPGNDDWFEVRIKIKDTAPLNNPGIIKFDLELHKNSTNYYKISHSKQVVSSGSLDTNQFYTINFRMPTNSGSWANTIPYDEIGTATRMVFLLTGLKNPSTVNFEVDYIYIGPKDKMPSAQSRHLLFDFSNSGAAQYRYQTDVYDGINYDVDGVWDYTGNRTLAPDVDNGALKITTSSNNTAYYYWARTGSDQINHGVKYKPSVKDYCQVRFKVENGEATDPTAPYFNVYFSTDGTTIYDGNQQKFHFTLSDKTDGQWITLSFPITNNRWYDADLILDLQFMFGGIKSTAAGAVTFYVDYIYIGPAQPQDLNYTAEDHKNYNDDNVLFFDFSGSKEEEERYDQSVYGFLNFSDLSLWKYNSTRNTTDLGEDSLIIKINGNFDPAVDKNCNAYVQSTTPDSNAMSMPLNYIPSETDVVQVRVRFSNCIMRTDKTNPYFYLYFMANRAPVDGHGVWIDDYVQGKIDKTVFTTGEWTVVTVPLNTAFRSADVINAIRFNFINIVSPNADPGIVEVDYVYVGPENLAPTTESYGYDSSYDNDRGLSDGESLLVEGKGYKTATAKAYSVASFSFTGTGFDIVSRTGNNQATIKVTVKNAAGATEKTMTVNNKGELKLYQIPVVSMEGLAFGEHTVTVEVNSPVTYTGVLAPLSRGEQFYLDAVRIYDPIEVEKDTLSQEEEKVLNAYVTDLEAYPYIKEVRDVILSATEFSALEGTGTGAVYLDQAEEVTVPDGFQSGTNGDNNISIDNHITYEVSTYEKAGPKNEVYLNKGQAVAFKLRLNTEETPVSIDVGAKAINVNDTPVLNVGYTTKNTDKPTILQTWNLTTNTAMYYPIQFTESSFATDDDGRYIYLVISNSGNDSILSVTDLKFAYDCEPTIIDTEKPPVKKAAAEAELVSFLVDGDITDAVTRVLNSEISHGDTVKIDENISIKHTLNLASDISINYAILAESLAAYEDFHLTCMLYNGTAVTLEPVLKGEYYYFTLSGLTAVTINDEVKATLYMTTGDQRYTSGTDTYSVAQYAYSQLSRENMPEKLKALCANLLRYGAYAQTFKNYRIHALADSKLTEEQMAYLADLDTVSFGNANTVGAELEAPSIVWEGKSLDLASKVGLTFVFSVKDPEINTESLTLKVCYTDNDGKNITATVTGAEVYNEEKGFYSFRFNDLLAAELRSVLTVQVYEGDTPLSCTLTYSADTYGNNKTGTLGQLCKALFAYSDCAKAFFAK